MKPVVNSVVENGLQMFSFAASRSYVYPFKNFRFSDQSTLMDFLANDLGSFL